MSRNYSFDQVSILLVEDNHFMAHLLGSILKALRIGRVLRARSGSEAQEIIGARVSALPGQSIDIVLSDWHMELGDGLSLLRWVRAHPHQNVRLLPFIMVTADADVPRVRLARDAGVTGFLRKPVTVDAVVKRLINVTERPRPFIRARTYLGPDRRHTSVPVQGADRRQVT